MDLFWLVCYHQNFEEILPVKSITADEMQSRKNPLFFSKVRLNMGNSHMSEPLPKQCTVMPKFGNNLQGFSSKELKKAFLSDPLQITSRFLIFWQNSLYPQLHYSLYSASLPDLNQTKEKKKPTEHLREGDKVFKKEIIREWREILCSVYT